MSPTLLDHNKAQSGPNGSGNTPSLNTTGANALIAFVGFLATATTPTMADSKSNTWVNIGSIAVGNNPKLACFVCLNPSSVGTLHTFSATGTNTFASLQVSAFSVSGGMLTEVLVTASNAAGTSKATGSITPADSSGELLMTALVFNAVATASVDSSFSLLDQLNFVASNSYGIAAAYIVQGTAANPTWTVTASAALVVMQVAFITANPPTLAGLASSQASISSLIDTFALSEQSGAITLLAAKSATNNAALSGTGLGSVSLDLASGAGTCLNIAATARANFGSSNVANFGSNSSFSCEALVSPNYARSTNTADAQQVISLKLQQSGSFQGWYFLLDWNRGALVPSYNAPTIKFTPTSGTGLYVGAAYDVTNSVTAHLAVTYDTSGTYFAAGTADCVQHYVNGREAPSRIDTGVKGPLTASITNTSNPILFDYYTGSDPFVGKIQDVGTYGAALTKAQVRANYLVSVNKTIFDVSKQYTQLGCFKGTETGGRRLRLEAATYTYDSTTGLWWAYSMDMSGGQTGGSDSNFHIIAHKSYNLVDWTYVGVALDVTGINDGGGHNIWGIQRANVIKNPTTGKWVMWAHGVFSSDYLFDAFVIATADHPQDAFTIQTNAYRPDAKQNGDLSLWQETDGSAAYLVYAANNTVWASQLTNSNYLTIIGSSVDTGIGSREGLCLFKNGSTYFIFHSAVQAYQRSANDLKYHTATSVTGTWTSRGTPTSWAPDGQQNGQSGGIMNIPSRGVVFHTDVWEPLLLDRTYYAWASPTFSGTAMTLLMTQSLDISAIGAGSNPAAASGVAGTWQGTAQVNLTWTNNDSNAAGIQVQRSTGSNFTTNPVAFLLDNGTTSYSDTTALKDGTTYFYRIYNYTASGTNLSGSATPTTPSGTVVPVIHHRRLAMA